MECRSARFALAVAIAGTQICCGEGTAESAADGAPGSGESNAGGRLGMGGGNSPSAGGAMAADGVGSSAGGTQSSTGGKAAARGSAAAIYDAGAPMHEAGSLAPDAARSVPDAASSKSYVCSLILGIATTSEWFGGFEKVVDGARWELKFQDSAHIEKWADPANAVWSLPITSPCVEHPNEPDRVVFMGVNYDYASVDLFLPKYVAVLNNVKAKYPSVKRLDVMTYTRGPGNKECVGADRSKDSYIKPAQDEAIAMFAAAYPGFVFPAPQWEVMSCDDFTLCPHLTGAANAVISKTIGEYFSTH